MTATAERRGGALWLTLSRPRGNSLAPGLLDALCAALADIGDARAIVLVGAGRAFSSGGDLQGFLDNAATPETISAYAGALVARLNDAILALLASPVPTIACVNGPATGGACGLAFACDRIVMADNAFLQPCYALLGFAPDGGWTALLPERIGVAGARDWLITDGRLDAAQARAAGVVDAIAPSAALMQNVQRWVDELDDAKRDTIARTRALLRPAHAIEAIAARLEDERRAFVAQIATPETLLRLRAFKSRLRGAHENNKSGDLEPWSVSPI